jgi:hypothetical protein
VVLKGSPTSESFIEAMLAGGSAPGDHDGSQAARRARVLEAGRPVESYRRVSLDDALGWLQCDDGHLT